MSARSYSTLWLLACAASFGIPFALASAAASAQDSTVWTFDRLDTIGGQPVKVEGTPQIVDTPAGRAVQFDGVDDALIVDNHPIAGAERFTVEAVFRPDGGAFEQRWLHIAERDPAGRVTNVDPQTRADANARLLFEIRVVGDQWYLDAFANGPGYSHALMAKDKLHPVGEWYHVAQVYDGKEYRSYVNGVLQASAAIAFTPQGAGSTSVGVRLNRVNYFKGAVRQVRFTRRALTPGEFLTLPARR